MLTDNEFETASASWIRRFVRATSEGAALDFKELLSATDSGRFELAKDLSAFANSGGGSLLVGVREDPPGTFAVVGTHATLGAQPLDEWVENVAAGAVRPRLDFRTRLVKLRGGGAVALVQVPASAAAPHMVELQGKNRYYVRRGRISSPATSDEVASMFERTQLQGQARNAFLAARSLDDPFSEHLGVNYDSARLTAHSGWTNESGGHERGRSGNPKAILAYAPAALAGRLSEVRTSAFAARLGVTGIQKELPMPSVLILPDQVRTTLDGLYGATRGRNDHDGLVRYLRISKGGYVEIGLTEIGGSGSALATELEGHSAYHLTYLVAAAANFLGLLHALHAEAGLVGGGDWLVALTKVEGAELGGFGDGWRDPFVSGPAAHAPAREPAEPGILRVTPLPRLDLDKDEIREQAYALGDDIEAAWGGDERRYLSRVGARPGELGWGLTI